MGNDVVYDVVHAEVGGKLGARPEALHEGTAREH